MQWLIAVLVIAVLGLAAIVSSGGLGEMSKEPVSDVYRQDLPDRPLTGADIETLRFGTTLRGYAMGQVDDVLARLGREIAERDEIIAERDEIIAELRAERELEPAVELGSEADPEVADPEVADPEVADPQVTEVEARRSGVE